jgi:replicative DNA helicase
VGGAVFISELTSRVASGAHVEYHARIVAQKYLARELISFASQVESKAFDESKDVDDLLQEAEGKLFEISQRNVKKDVTQIDPVIGQAIEQIQAAANRKSGLSGLESGYHDLDKLTSGWQKSDLIIIAARPAMGKTAFVLSMARNMAVEHETGVAFFSLEMSATQLMMRLVVAETGLSSTDIRSGRLTPEQWRHLENKVKPLGKAPLYIDDTPALSVFEFRSKARRLKIHNDIKIIIIDYLQLMTGTKDSKGNREQEVAFISRTLKAIAKELDVPIIALSQLNRSTESRGGSKRPQLSDLRESGAIEQDADIVAFIHRPEYYGFTQTEDGLPTAGIAEIILAKHRNGAVTDVQLRFLKEQARFADLDTADMPLGGEAQGQQQYVDYASESVTGGAIGGDALGALPNNEFGNFGAPVNIEDAPF